MESLTFLAHDKTASLHVVLCFYYLSTTIVMSDMETCSLQSSRDHSNRIKGPFKGHYSSN